MRLWRLTVRSSAWTSQARARCRRVSVTVFCGTVCSDVAPHVRAQLGLDYAIPHLTAKSTVSLTSQPKVDLAVTTGHNDIVCGGETSFDTAKNTVTRWSIGAGAPEPCLQV